jgi:hypothetical protein
MDRGAARRIYRHHRIHFDGANWESGPFRNGTRLLFRETFCFEDRTSAPVRGTDTHAHSSPSHILLQLQELAHERIMMVLELSHKLLVRIPAYRHVQENVLGRIIRCGVCHRLTILECGLSALEVRRLQFAGEPALVVVLAVAVSRRLGVR